MANTEQDKTTPQTIHIWRRSNDLIYYAYSGEGTGIFESVMHTESLSDAVQLGDVRIGSDVS